MDYFDQSVYAIVEQGDGRFRVLCDERDLMVFSTIPEARSYGDSLIRDSGGSWEYGRSFAREWSGTCPSCKKKGALRLTRTEDRLSHECGETNCRYERTIGPAPK
jgi:hypothetical protein